MYVDPETSEVVTATETVSDLPQVTARFTFVEGLTWEDGTPVTSADSVLAARLTCDPDTPSSKYLCERTSHYKAIDDRTVEWQGLPGYADQTYYLNIYMPLASHQLGADGVTRMDEMAAAAITEDENFTRRPYSYGPFKIDSWESGEKIVVSRNEYYWRADEGLPFLDKLTYRIVPDTNALFLAAKAGEVDVAIGLDFGANEQIDEAAAAGEIVAHYVPGTFWERINFNLDPLDDRPPFLACKDLRKAVVMGSDRQSMVNVIMKGKTTVADTPAGPEHWAYPPEGTLMRIDYDREGAAALLEGMGFVDADGDGVREAQTDITCTITTDIDGNTADRVIPAGTPIEMTISTTEGRPIRQETTLLFQQNMADIGIKMNLEYMPANVFFESAPDGALDSRRFDMALYSSGFGLNPPVGWYCTEIQSPETNWAGSNANGWCDPGYDRAGKRAENTIDRDAALPDYYEAQRLFTEGIPMMGLFNRVEVSASGPGMVNFRPNSTAVADTWNVESWGFGE
jgi:peptide/nickel transport system substrate-binding protein